MTPRDEARAAPMMFSTNNTTPIEGLFEAESDDHGQ
jgi:hypothetical protein